MQDFLPTTIESSYKASHLGHLFYSLARSHQPKLAVELGVFEGYSSLHIAAALRDNAPLSSELHLIDLWDNYPHRHCALEVARNNFAEGGFLDIPELEVSFLNRDALELQTHYAIGNIDFLHIDVSNTGDKLKKLLDLWAPKMSKSPNALIVIEGGSVARDNIPWMQQYNCEPIRALLHSEPFNRQFEHFCLSPFPSVTLVRPRRDSTS